MKQFKCIAVSSNTNNFGMAGHVAVAKDGTTIQIDQSRFGSIKEIQKDDLISASEDKHGAWYLDFATYGETLVSSLPKPSKKTLKAIWEA